MSITLLSRSHTELADVDDVLDELMGTHVQSPDALAEIATVTVCADRVNGLGGDFVDVKPASDTSVTVLIGDLCGHCPELARSAAAVKLLVRRLLELHTGLGEVLARTNYLLLHAMPEQLASAFLGRIDFSTGKMAYASAGHEPGVILRQGRSDFLKIGGTLLGVEPNLHYHEVEVDLSENVLALFTDGLTEAVVGPERSRLGADCLVAILRDSLDRHPVLTDVANSVMRQVVEERAVEVTDDATLLLIRPLAGVGTIRALTPAAV